MTNYVYAPGGRVSGFTAQAVGQALEQIRDNGDGFFTPADVLEESRPDYAPLHGAFEWDDTTAAEAHRLTQAGMLVRAVRVQTFAVESNEVRVVRAFVSVGNSAGTLAYTSVARAMSEPDLRAYVLSEALASWRSFEAKYATLLDLGEASRLIYDAIEANRDEVLVTS